MLTSRLELLVLDDLQIKSLRLRSGSSVLWFLCYFLIYNDEGRGSWRQYWRVRRKAVILLQSPNDCQRVSNSCGLAFFLGSCSFLFDYGGVSVEPPKGFDNLL
jgi:hypothetical protein